MTNNIVETQTSKYITEVNEAYRSLMEVRKVFDELKDRRRVALIAVMLENGYKLGIISKVEKMLEKQESSPRRIVIIGDWGRGKTFLAKILQDLYPEIIVKERREPEDTLARKDEIRVRQIDWEDVCI